MRQAIVDTGPLVAFMDDGEPYHSWSETEFAKVTGSLVTCEAVIAEADYIIRSRGGDPGSLYEAIGAGVLDISFSLAREWQAVSRLLGRFADQKMQLADACIVRLSELYEDCIILTTDVRDFSVYRRFERRPIPFRAPQLHGS